jgi:hypothetical protein
VQGNLVAKCRRSMLGNSCEFNERHYMNYVNCMKWNATMEFEARYDIASENGKARILRIQGLASMTSKTDTLFAFQLTNGGLCFVSGDGNSPRSVVAVEARKEFGDCFTTRWIHAQEYVAPRSPLKGTKAEAAATGGDLASVLGSALSGSIMPMVDAKINAAMEGIEERVASCLEASKSAPIVIRVEGMKDVVLDGTEHGRFGDLVKVLPSLPSKDRNVLLYGEAGSGKSFAAKQYAERIGLEYGAVSFSGGVSESMFTGRFLPSSSGVFEWKATPFTRLYSEGGVFCLDELDKADPQVATALNMALANGEIVTTEGVVLKRHKDFVAIGGANSLTFSKTYTAAQPQDGSLLNRFYKIKWDLCPMLLRSVLQAMAGNEAAARILRIREAVNNALTAKRFSDWNVGMRVCERMAAVAKAGMCPVATCLHDEVNAMAAQYSTDVMAAARSV